jgi:hypothetical protein
VSSRAGVIVPLVGAALLAIAALALRRRSVPVIDTRRDTSAFGPLEHVGPIGNTGERATGSISGSSLPLAGRPGEIPNLDTSLPPIFSGVDACRNRSVGDYNPACIGDTWGPFRESDIPNLAGAAEWIRTGAARKLSPEYVRAALLDPSVTWYAVDYRAIPQT